MEGDATEAAKAALSMTNWKYPPKSRLTAQKGPQSMRDVCHTKLHSNVLVPLVTNRISSHVFKRSQVEQAGQRHTYKIPVSTKHT